MKLREYKIRNLALLARLQEELPTKYGEEARNDIEKLIVKTHALRTFTLADYLTTIILLSRKYPELKALIPSVEQVNDLLRDQD